MSSWEQPLSPRRYLPAVLCVVLLHAAVIYALVSGLGQQGVQVARQMIDAYIIEDKPRPEPVAPPQPKPLQPPTPRPKAPPVMAVPEHKPLQQAPAMTSPAPEQTVPAPPQPPSPAAATTPEPSTQVTSAPPPSVGVSCPGYRQTLLDAGFPREAARAGVESGEVLLSFTIASNGGVKDVAIVNSSNRVFNRHSIQVVGQFKCQGQSQDVKGVQVPLVFTTR